MQKRERKSGEMNAALGALWLGLAGMAGSHLWSTADPAGSKPVLLKLGSWVPGWWGIGPFAGKEVIGLLLWLCSWLILHFLLKGRDTSIRKVAVLFVIGFAIIIVAIWPPVYHAFLGWPPGLPE